MIMIKKYLIAAIIALPASISAQTTNDVSAGWGYVETLDGEAGASGIGMPGASYGRGGTPSTDYKLTSWTNPSAMAVYYFHHPKDEMNMKALMTIESGATVKLTVNVIDPNSPSTILATNDVSVDGTGSEQTVDLITCTFSKSQYYRYELRCTQGCASIDNISCFRFTTGSSSIKTYVANYLSSPSVNPSFSTTSTDAPSGNSYDWLYSEVLMPEGTDISGTYLQVLGISSGYMGIQNNGFNEDGSKKHTVLFSIWDNGDTDSDPDLPDYLKAGAVDWSDSTTVNRFGGEGTGTQTYINGHIFEAGQWVRFLTNARPETTSYTNSSGETVAQNNMLITCWFDANDGKGWQYVATVRRRDNSNYHDSWYSFLENYSPANGQVRRFGYFRNGYGHGQASGKWYHFNKISVGHTDGGTDSGARNDYGYGASETYPGAFYLTSGGYTDTAECETTVSLSTSTDAVDGIDLDEMAARVDQAIANEKARVEQEEAEQNAIYDKTGWEVIDYSSQEETGEGENGFAANAIDGDDDSFWTPEWLYSTAQCPHHMTIDMKQTLEVKQFKIAMGTRTDRYIKAFDIYGSTDNTTWDLIYTTEAAEQGTPITVDLDEAVNIRYFKIVIRSTYASDGPFCYIYEITVSAPIKTAGISQATAEKASSALEVRTNGEGRITVIAPQSGKAATLQVYDTAGRRLCSQAAGSLRQGQAVSVAVPTGTGGIVAVVLTIDGKRHVRLIRP